MFGPGVCDWLVLEGGIAMMGVLGSVIAVLALAGVAVIIWKFLPGRELM